MTIVRLPFRRGLESLWRGRADSRLSSEDQIDALRRGQRNGEVDAFVSRREIVPGVGKVSFDYPLREHSAVSTGARRIICFSVFVGCRGLFGFCLFRCGNRRVVAFVSLED